MEYTEISESSASLLDLAKLSSRSAAHIGQYMVGYQRKFPHALGLPLIIGSPTRGPLLPPCVPYHWAAASQLNPKWHAYEIRYGSYELP